MPTDVERSLALAKVGLMAFAREFRAWLEQLDCGKGEALVDVVREKVHGSGLDQRDLADMLYVDAARRFAPGTGLPETVTWNNGIVQWEDSTTHDVLYHVAPSCRGPGA